MTYPIDNNLARRARRGFSVFLLAAGLGAATSGCAGLTDPIIPTYIPPNVRTYAGVTNGPANGVYWTKTDAVRMKVQIELRYAQDYLAYQGAKGSNEAALAAADALQTKLFDPETGLVTLGVATLLGGGGLLAGYRNGLKKPRPGDIPGDQHKAEVNAAGLTDPLKFQEKP